jgi:hypothetical protein
MKVGKLKERITQRFDEEEEEEEEEENKLLRMEMIVLFL